MRGWLEQTGMLFTLTTEGEMGTLAEIGVAISILLADALTNDCVRFRNA